MEKFISDLVRRYPILEVNAPVIKAVCTELIEAFERGNKLFVCGNGGSHSDADHISGELLKGFILPRPLSAELIARFAAADPADGGVIAGKLQMGLPAITLGAQRGLSTAFANDVDADLSYAQEILALGKPGDVLIGLSASGNSRNVRPALIASRALGIKSILFTGNRNGCCEKHADITLAVPEKETFKIQELHLPVYHTVCMIVEEHFYGGKK